MPHNISLRLTRLIRERSYLSGEVVRGHQRVMDLIEEVGQARARLHQAEQELGSLKRRREQLDRLIRQEAPSIDPTNIQTVQETPRTTKQEHGALITTVIENLRSSPQGISTFEMTQRIAPQFGLPWSTAAEQRDSMSRARRILNRLKTQGAVKRLPSTERRNGQKLARWLWIADADEPLPTQSPTATGQFSDPS